MFISKVLNFVPQVVFFSLILTTLGCDTIGWYAVKNDYSVTGCSSCKNFLPPIFHKNEFGVARNSFKRNICMGYDQFNFTRLNSEGRPEYSKPNIGEFFVRINKQKDRLVLSIISYGNCKINESIRYCEERIMRYPNDAKTILNESKEKTDFVSKMIVQSLGGAKSITYIDSEMIGGQRSLEDFCRNKMTSEFYGVFQKNLDVPFSEAYSRPQNCKKMTSVKTSGGFGSFSKVDPHLELRQMSEQWSSNVAVITDISFYGGRKILTADLFFCENGH